MESELGISFHGLLHGAGMGDLILVFKCIINIMSPWWLVMGMDHVVVVNCWPIKCHYILMT